MFKLVIFQSLFLLAINSEIRYDLHEQFHTDDTGEVIFSMQLPNIQFNDGSPVATETPESSQPFVWPLATIAADIEIIPKSNSSGCGIKNGYQDQQRIVGGKEAKPREFPWMAAIFKNGRLFCGGSLIDNYHVLTAAHCVAKASPWDISRMSVRLGAHNIKSQVEAQRIERRIKKVVRHRDFDFQTVYNDIALLTLDTPVAFTTQISPISLPDDKDVVTGKTATVIGWGSLREMGPTPEILQKVNVSIWDNRSCRMKYGALAPGGIVEHFLCAGGANKDSCNGDSGGPLMVNEGRWKQHGIVSWGIGCGRGEYPGVYTRVTSFIPWITKNLKT